MSAPPGGGGSPAAAGQPPALGDNNKLQQLVNFPTVELIAVLAPLLEQLMERNDKLPLPELTSFHARSKPPLSIHSYLMRFVQYAPMANECYMLMLIYLDRISQTNSAFCVTALNAHRMIVTGLVLAAKFSQDRYYTNTHYARVGGLPVRELKALELEFLARIHYSLWADVEIIEAYWTQLLLHARRNDLLSETAKAALVAAANAPANAGLVADNSPRYGPNAGDLTSPQAHAAASRGASGGMDTAAGAQGGAVAGSASGEVHPAKRPKLVAAPDLGSMQIHTPEAMADYTDENMRYELLRRQQERLRQAQPGGGGTASQHAHGGAYPMAASGGVGGGGAGGGYSQGFAPSGGAGGASAHGAGATLHQSSQAQSQYPQQPLQHQAHTVNPYPVRVAAGAGAPPPASAPVQITGAAAGTGHGHGTYGARYPHQQQPVVQAQLSPNTDHLSPTARQAELSPASQGGSSRSGSLSTSFSSVDFVSPQQTAAGAASSLVHRHARRQSSKSPYFNPARSPKVVPTSPLTLAPRGLGAPGSGAWSGSSPEFGFPNGVPGVSPQQASAPAPPVQYYGRASPSPKLAPDSAAAQSAMDVRQERKSSSPRSGVNGSPCGQSPATSATQSPVIVTTS